jgi:hypothetical protein
MFYYPENSIIGMPANNGISKHSNHWICIGMDGNSGNLLIGMNGNFKNSELIATKSNYWNKFEGEIWLLEWMEILEIQLLESLEIHHWNVWNLFFGMNGNSGNSIIGMTGDSGKPFFGMTRYCGNLIIGMPGNSPLHCVKIQLVE